MKISGLKSTEFYGIFVDLVQLGDRQLKYTVGGSWVSHDRAQPYPIADRELPAFFSSNNCYLQDP